jgi:hypothetical protein
MIITSALRKKLGAIPGDYFKLIINNKDKDLSYYVRCRIKHSFKVTPGLDLFTPHAFVSEEQAQYIYQVLG